MSKETFSFAELDKRIKEIPTPSLVDEFLPPDDLLVFEALGAIGIVIGLLPSVLLQFMESAPWMVTMTYVGLAVMIIGFLPGLLRKSGSIFKSISGWKKEFLADIENFFQEDQEIIQWLTQFPKEELQNRMRFIQDYRERVSGKSAFLFGHIEKLGILPALIAAYVSISNIGAPQDISPLLAVGCALLVLLYFLSLTVSLRRLRSQFYEMLLCRAIDKVDAQPSRILDVKSKK
jgi:hypothetical protein